MGVMLVYWFGGYVGMYEKGMLEVSRVSDYIYVL